MASRAFGSFCAILLAAAAAATSCGRECEEGPACGAAVVVTLKQPTSINDDELLIEASFDDRVLRCRSTRASPSQCDAGVRLIFHSVPPDDAGPTWNDPLQWPYFADAVEVVDSWPAQLTIRLSRGGKTISEQSFSLSYREFFPTETCRTCRVSEVSM